VVSGPVDGGFAWGGERTTYAKLAHPVDQGRSLHPKPFGGTISAADHPIARFQCSKNMISFYFSETVNWHIELGL